MKKLYRSKKNRMVSGVIGGMGEYASIDPTILRVGWALATLFTIIIYPGVIAYIIAMLIIPVRPNTDSNSQPEA